MLLTLGIPGLLLFSLSILYVLQRDLFGKTRGGLSRTSLLNLRWSTPMSYYRLVGRVSNYLYANGWTVNVSTLGEFSLTIRKDWRSAIVMCVPSDIRMSALKAADLVSVKNRLPGFHLLLCVTAEAPEEIDFEATLACGVSIMHFSNLGSLDGQFKRPMIYKSEA